MKIGDTVQIKQDSEYGYYHQHEFKVIDILDGIIFPIVLGNEEILGDAYLFMMEDELIIKPKIL